MMKSFTGYEDILDELKNYTKEKYEKLNDDDKIKMIDEIFNIYRNKNIFPISYYNEDGIFDEINKCINKKVEFDGNVLDLKYNQGSSLCKFLFPNLHKVECKNAKNNSMYDRFYNDHKLKRAIKLCLEIKKSVTPSEIRSSLELIGGNVATNFKPMNAKALYEYFTPKNGMIYDFSCGFGGRMLGALTSEKNFKYFGVEPNTETYNNLIKLGNYIEKTTNTKNRFKILQIGSEELPIKNECSVDFAFSSPPYFNLEKYSNEETQCYNRYSTLDEWFDIYVYNTIKNIYKLLKYDRYYAVNIADFKLGKDDIKLVDRWIDISQDIGFEYIKNISMKLTKRTGVGHNKEKKEGIFVFKK